MVDVFSPQHLLKEQEHTGREVEEEAEMRMRKAEREEESYRELLHSTETNMQVSDTVTLPTMEPVS